MPYSNTRAATAPQGSPGYHGRVDPESRAPRSRSWLHWSWLLSTSLLVLIAIGAPFLFGLFSKGPAVPEALPVSAAAASDRLREEHHYSFALAVIELAPRKPSGKRWDPDGSGPDIAYRVLWQGNLVHESATKDDTLLARWSNTSLDAGRPARPVSIDSSLKGARITARAADRLEVRIRDSDLIDDDELDPWSVPVADLRVGDQHWDHPVPGVVAVITRVLPLEEIDLETLVR